VLDEGRGYWQFVCGERKTAKSQKKFTNVEKVNGIGGSFIVRGTLLLSLSGTATRRQTDSVRLRRIALAAGIGTNSICLSRKHRTTLAMPPRLGWSILGCGTYAMGEQLRDAGISVEVNQQRYPDGRFARLTDSEGNPIHVWQPEVQLLLSGAFPNARSISVYGQPSVSSSFPIIASALRGSGGRASFWFESPKAD